MRILSLLTLVFFFFGCEPVNDSSKTTPTETASNYVASRAPLTSSPYVELPLGSIQPHGWLQDQLQRMADGMTGNLDSLYSEVVGPRNGWLGGDGDGWERGPYWIDGLLPLAYILDDAALKIKALEWVEWTLENQTDEGYLGPIPFQEPPEHEPGLQRGNRQDWWPKMVMLKVLMQYHNATQDPRVVEAMTRYFRYQLKELPERPLDHLTFWANRRGGDNLQAVYWLYNITGDAFLLDLGDIIAEQTFPWTSVYLNDSQPPDPLEPDTYFVMKRYPFDTAEIRSTSLSQKGSIHTVNFAQGLKQPAILYQRSGDEMYIDAIRKALHDIKKYHGQAQGMYGGDEPLHGANPVQGIEFCSISEEMFSLETIIKITGDMQFADLLERITYNALPAQADDDFTSRQYFQAANQIALQEYVDPTFETNNHLGTDFVFGLLSGYPCCTTNMHQSWPKFVQNLFYATTSGGVAAFQYAPASVNMLVGDGIPVTITETTGYPFRDEITFTLALDQEATFPFHLRIPSWAKDAKIILNGEEVNATIAGQIAVIDRIWKDQDILTLQLPMELTTSKWFEFTTAVERGPLVYALGVKGKATEKNRGDRFGSFIEMEAIEPWNFGLIEDQLTPELVQVVENEWDGSYPWNLENAPVSLRVKAFQVTEWTAPAGIPHLPSFWRRYREDVSDRVQDITLVPYGCTTLRISQFPAYTLP